MTPIATHELAQRMQKLPDGLAVPDPPFEFELGIAADYPSALAGEIDQPVAAAELVGLGADTGRVLVLGNGGAGKTSLMSRLWRDSRSQGQPAVWVDLRAFGELVPDEAWPDQDDQRAELLLGTLARPAVSSVELDVLEPSSHPLILIDGINEVSNAIAETIVETATHLARRHPQATVIVTDRLVRRTAVDERWRLVRLMAVRLEGQPVHNEPLLRDAFFLNLMIAGGASATADRLDSDRFLARHVGLGSEEIAAAQQAAAEAYISEESRTFEMAPFAATAGAEVVAKLRAAGTLVERDSRGHFSHQLVHDWLAAGWLAADEGRWTNDHLDALSFRGSSFDAIAFALDRLDGSDQVDRLVRRVYDWNYYGAGYILARARALGRLAVSSTMTVALLAMLGERQWDPIVATVDRVQDALRIVGDPIAHRMLAAHGPEEVRDIVAAHPGGDETFERWRHLFLLPDGAPVSASLIDALDDPESLIGWTAANVLRRAAPEADDVRAVADRLVDTEHVATVVRWRAAHVLGGWSAPEGHRALLRAISSDPYPWVRYGAIRSLIDDAACDVEHREELLGHVVALLPKLRQGPAQVVVELERSLLRRPAPARWREALATLVELAYATAPDEDEAHRWRRLAGELARTGGT